jgi:hypothetical protein
VGKVISVIENGIPKAIKWIRYVIEVDMPGVLGEEER